MLLSALYQDTVDMSCVLRGSPSVCSLSEIQAMVSSGRCQMTVVDEAMELYQIGQFLDAQIISQGTVGNPGLKDVTQEGGRWGVHKSYFFKHNQRGIGNMF